MTRAVNLYQAKTQLSALVEAAASGEEIVIAKNGVAKARLVPLPPTVRRRIPTGLLDITFVAEDFDERDPRTRSALRRRNMSFLLDTHELLWLESGSPKARPQGSVREMAAAAGFAEVPIGADDAELAGAIGWEHKDPFDRRQPA